MRGGAIPLIVWGVLNLILLVIAGIWEGLRWHNGGLHVVLTAFTVLVVFLGGVVLIVIRGQAGRKGAPEYERRIDVLPRISFAAAGAGLGCGLVGFGIVFGKWLIIAGGVLLVASLARLLSELAWQHRTVSSVRRGRRR